MSFRRSRASGSGEPGDRGDQRARQDPAEELRATIRDLIGDSQDTEVRQALRASFEAMQDDRRPSIHVVINQVAQLVSLTGGNTLPRDAIFRMARARFDYQAAVHAYLEEAGYGRSLLSSPPSRGERDGERRVSDDTEEESASSSAEQTTATVFQRYLAVNPGIDRSAAKKGYPDPSKLTITIHRPDGKPDKVIRYPGLVDFSQPVRSLNRWRSQVFRRHFGGSRPFRQHFHELEKDWLLQEHIDFERKRLAEGKLVDYSAMKWGEIAERFNRRFEGQLLPGVQTPRPSRTVVALRTERSRVKKITDHTGIVFRMQPRKGRSTKGPEKLDVESEKKDSEDDGEEDGRGPRDTRRGDSPPGRKPWRKDSDDEDRGGGRLSLGV